jgi:hypothetical protein
MDVPASPAKRPDWQACLGAFQVRFRRAEGRDALERYPPGRLTELPTKHGETLAQAVPGTSAQRRQECLTHMPWAAEDLTRQRVQKMVTEATWGEGGWWSTRRAVPSQRRPRSGSRDSMRARWARGATGRWR